MPSVVMMDPCGGGLLTAFPRMSGVYTAGGAGPQVIALDSTHGALLVRDNATPLGTTLFGVQDSTGTSQYVDVTAFGISSTGTVTAGLTVGFVLGSSRGLWLGDANTSILAEIGTAQRFELRNSLATATNDTVLRIWAIAGTRTAGKLFTVGDGVTFTQRLGLEAVATDNIEMMFKSHAAYAGSEARKATSAVRTTDATVTTLWTKAALADNTLYFFEANVIGRDEGGTNRAYYKRALRVHRQAAGVATAGTVQTPYTDESNAAWDCTIDVDGANGVRVRVTGAAAVNVSWVATVYWQAVSTNA